MGAHPLRQRLDQVATRAFVDDGPLAPVQPDAGREAPRPDDLHLEPTRVAVEGLGELVEILTEQRSRATGILARPVDEPPADRLKVDVQVDEQPGRSPDHVAARPPVGQLGQVGQVVSEQIPHDVDRRSNRRSGPRSDTAGESHALSLCAGASALP